MDGIDLKSDQCKPFTFMDGIHLIGGFRVYLEKNKSKM